MQSVESHRLIFFFFYTRPTAHLFSSTLMGNDRGHERVSQRVDRISLLATSKYNNDSLFCTIRCFTCPKAEQHG